MPRKWEPLPFSSSQTASFQGHGKKPIVLPEEHSQKTRDSLPLQKDRRICKNDKDAVEGGSSSMVCSDMFKRRSGTGYEHLAESTAGLPLTTQDASFQSVDSEGKPGLRVVERAMSLPDGAWDSHVRARILEWNAARRDERQSSHKDSLQAGFQSWEGNSMLQDVQVQSNKKYKTCTGECAEWGMQNSLLELQISQGSIISKSATDLSTLRKDFSSMEIAMRTISMSSLQSPRKIASNHIGNRQRFMNFFISRRKQPSSRASRSSSSTVALFPMGRKTEPEIIDKPLACPPVPTDPQEYLPRQSPHPARTPSFQSTVSSEISISTCKSSGTYFLPPSAGISCPEFPEAFSSAVPRRTTLSESGTLLPSCSSQAPLHDIVFQGVLEGQNQIQEHVENSDSNTVEADQFLVPQLITKISCLPEEIRTGIALKLLSRLDPGELEDMVEDCKTFK